MSENDMADWQKRLENMETTETEDSEPAALPCKNCEKPHRGRECDFCGRLSW